MADVDVLYNIWQSDNSTCAIDHEDAPLVDRAMKLWAERRIDTWLTLRGPTGSEFCALASTITSAQRTSVEERHTAVARDKAIDDERKENRRCAGYVESEG